MPSQSSQSGSTDERASMYAALAFGGFVDADETERVTKWAAERIAELENAIRSLGAYGGPLYLLEPSQGERPDPVRAARELRRIIVEALA